MYFQWLGDRVSLGVPGNSFFSLGKILHEIPFRWTVPNDDNRQEDGLALRQEYAQEHQEPSGIFFDGAVSVLEVLVALAIRIDSEIVGRPGYDDSGRWFREMLRNLDLEDYDDLSIHTDSRAKEDIKDIIETWLSRRFKRNGEGSPFPIRESQRDMRSVELWYQMQLYIGENYEV